MDKITVHVICCNDSVEYAVVGEEIRAKEKLDDLRQAHYDRNRRHCESFDSYKNRYYWHIHSVKGE